MLAVSTRSVNERHNGNAKLRERREQGFLDAAETFDTYGPFSIVEPVSAIEHAPAGYAHGLTEQLEGRSAGGK